MPIYEYQCQSCGHKQEIMHRISETPPLKCAACGANELKKLISAVGFQLKGTGWYETDFKNKGGAKSERTPGESNSDKAASDKKDSNAEKKSGVSESKPASKKSDAAKPDN